LAEGLLLSLAYPLVHHVLLGRRVSKFLVEVGLLLSLVHSILLVRRVSKFLVEAGLLLSLVHPLLYQFLL
jgi:hypothetical protein